MTRIDFYFNVANAQDVVADLVKSALIKHRQVTIVVDEQLAASKLGACLWQYKPESFLPNALSSSAVAAQTPIVIHWQNQVLLQDDMLINLTVNQPAFFSRFTQLVELVTDVEHDKVAARARFKFYRDRGYDIKSINLAQTKIE